MSQLYDRIVADRGRFERLLARIPTFGGYLDMAARRAADRALRDYIADSVSQHLGDLVHVQKQILDGDSGLSWMQSLESARLQWQTYHDRIVAAAPGYAGFFALNKIDAEDLERLYSFDEAQAQYADRFGESIVGLKGATGQPEVLNAAIDALEALGREANDALRLRDDVFTGLSK